MDRIRFIANLTIPQNSKNSQVLRREDYWDCVALWVVCKEAALTGTVTLQGGNIVGASADADFGTAQSPPGTDVTIGPAKGIPLMGLPMPSFRLHSTSDEAADRVFAVFGQMAERYYS